MTTATVETDPGAAKGTGVEKDREDKGPLPEPTIRRRVGWMVRKSPVGLAYYRRRRRQAADIFLLSYPKCGRTWLRLMVGKALAGHFQIGGDVDFMELKQVAKMCPGLPRLIAKHDDHPELKTPSELVSDKREYRDVKVILLVRDVRDLIVSLYFARTRRRGIDAGSLSEFMRRERSSVKTMIRYYNIWEANRQVPLDFLRIRYEDLHADAAGQVRGLLEFIGVKNVSDRVIQEAVDFASFDNMRQMEVNDTLNSQRLRPANPDDPESFKTRKGKVGGYAEYMTDDDIAYIDGLIASELSPAYGY